MHESTVMRGIFQEIQKATAERRIKTVRTVTIRLGALTPFSPGHFEEHFFEAAAGTPVEHAKLIVKADTDVTADDAQSIVLEELEVDCE